MVDLVEDPRLVVVDGVVLDRVVPVPITVVREGVQHPVFCGGRTAGRCPQDHQHTTRDATSRGATYTMSFARRFTTSTVAKWISTPPLVPQGICVTESVCTVTWISAIDVRNGSLRWNPGRVTSLSSAPPRQYTPTWPSDTVWTHRSVDTVRKTSRMMAPIMIAAGCPMCLRPNESALHPKNELKRRGAAESSMDFTCHSLASLGGGCLASLGRGSLRSAGARFARLRLASLGGRFARLALAYQ